MNTQPLREEIQIELGFIYRILDEGIENADDAFNAFSVRLENYLNSLTND